MSEDADVDYMMVLQREVSELRAEIERLRAALESAEQIIADFIGMYGDSGAGLVLKQVREALGETV